MLFQQVELGRHRCPSLRDLLTVLSGLGIHVTGSSDKPHVNFRNTLEI
jgi:hypothetical protein